MCKRVSKFLFYYEPRHQSIFSPLDFILTKSSHNNVHDVWLSHTDMEGTEREIQCGGKSRAIVMTLFNPKECTELSSN